MPVIETKGAASSQGFGEFAKTNGTVANYIEDVFSTWLYTGNGSTQTVTNGIDLSTKGGLTWIKDRSAAAGNCLFDTNRGTGRHLLSNATSAEIINATSLTSYNSTGFSLGSYTGTNQSPDQFAAWTFRKQPKFFDVVTYTGTGSATTIAHSLGSVPGCIMVKRTDTTSNWQVYHNGLTSAAYSIQLNLTNAQASATTVWNSTAPTSSVFSVGTDATVNASGGTYVAYIFAHNAGGFGLTGTDNVISCGSYTGTGVAGNAISLGYEPQYVMIKRTNSTGGWLISDVMRQMSNTDYAYVFAQASNAEAELFTPYVVPAATGFTLQDTTATNISGATYIYIAIRRGPMKVPTDGTKVFKPVSATPSGATTIVTNFPVDLSWSMERSQAYGSGNNVFDRLRGSTTTAGAWLTTQYDYSETTFATTGFGFSSNTSIIDNWNNTYLSVNDAVVYWSFRRAPGFFDEVCYTGNGTNGYKNHNLTVVPELIILKLRSGAQDWFVWQPSSVYVGSINTSAAFVNNGALSPATATQFTALVDTSSATYVAYLFATCAGVSKVGNYTGNGTTQTINCGFAAGARFVLIKRTDAVGDWYVYDTARGMTTLTDPYLLLDSVAAESATLGSVTTVTTGFAVNASILAAINTNAATYIFLAIA